MPSVVILKTRSLTVALSSFSYSCPPFGLSCGPFWTQHPFPDVHALFALCSPAAASCMWCGSSSTSSTDGVCTLYFSSYSCTQEGYPAYPYKYSTSSACSYSYTYYSSYYYVYVIVPSVIIPTFFVCMIVWLVGRSPRAERRDGRCRTPGCVHCSHPLCTDALLQCGAAVAWRCSGRASWSRYVCRSANMHTARP